jgi:ammonium transporter, Amt family
MHFIPGLSLRASEDAEVLGIDDAEMGEFAYDYVGIEQELGQTLDTGVSAAGGAREPDHQVKSVVSTAGSVNSAKERERVSSGGDEKRATD